MTDLNVLETMIEKWIESAVSSLVRLAGDHASSERLVKDGLPGLEVSPYQERVCAEVLGEIEAFCRVMVLLENSSNIFSESRSRARYTIEQAIEERRLEEDDETGDDDPPPSLN